ncbi:MAG: Uncharacterised protein [SAR116 cluster bacterium MED-G04]|jgi:2-methylcitrate dehydratase PrpD|nr:MAG: Uncharacterised protein [SAR116 cluster bacterium MED-G04]
MQGQHQLQGEFPLLIDGLSQFIAEADTSAIRHHPLIRSAVADGFACILGGASAEVTTRIRAALTPLGEGSASLYGQGGTMPAPAAAMINAVAGHANDLDDWEEPANTHPTVVILPAVLALLDVMARPVNDSVNDPVNDPVSGDAVADAYAIGFEVVARIGDALGIEHYARGFHATATIAPYGAAAACCRLMGLKPVEVAHALGLVASRAIGYTAQFGTDAKPFQAGSAAEAGLIAATLAAHGVTANPAILDHDRGVAALLAERTPADCTNALSLLASPWAMDQYGIVIKPWCSCGYTHRLMTMAREVREDHGIDSRRISGISAMMTDFHHAVLRFPRPSTRVEALFSAEACTAQMLAHGRLGLDDVDAGFWRDDEVTRLTHLMEVSSKPAINPNINYDPKQPERMTITLDDGNRIELACDFPLGSPSRPMPPAAHAKKFATMTGYPADRFHALLKWPDCRDAKSFFAEFAGG